MSNLSIFEEFPKLTFRELMNLGDDDISLCVNHTEAIYICKHSLEIGEVNISDIQKLWVDKLLRAYKAEELREENWIEIFSFLDEAYKQLVEDENVNTEVINELNIWIRDCLNFMEWMNPMIKEWNVGCICIVIGYALETVIGALKFYKQWPQDGNLKILLQNCLNIHNVALQMINHNLDGWTIYKGSEFSYLSEVIASLCVIGEQSSPVHFKIVVETWKTIGKITLHCAKYKHLDESVEKGGCKKWSQRPMLFLCKEIKKNITAVYKKDMLRQSVEQIDKYLRVTNFYTKLLQKLSCDFQHDDFPVPEFFYEIFLLSKSLPTHLEDHKIVLLLNKHVYSCLNEIFNVVYRHKTIFKMISESVFKNSTWCIVLEAYIRAIISNKDCIFIEQNVTFLMDSFKEIFKDVPNFIDPKKYNNFIELYAALAILTSNLVIQKAFKGFVLQSNVILSSGSCDILLIISSYPNNQSFEDYLEEYYFWRKCNQCFTPFTNNTRQLLVARIMKHYYKLCRKHKNYKKDKLWNEYSDIQISPKNYSLFTNLELNQNYYGENALQYLKEKLIKGVFEIKESLVQGVCCFESFYKMIVYLRILSTTKNFPLPTEYLTDVFNANYEIFYKVPENAAAFKLFIKSLLNFVTQNPKSLEEASLCTFVDHISKYHDIYFQISSFKTIKFLILLKQNKNFSSLNTSISQILSLVDSRKELKITKKLFDRKKVQWSRPSENFSLYDKINFDRQKELHTCHETQPSKKLRISPNPNSSKVKYLVANLLDKSLLLGNMINGIDESDINTLNNVVDNLKSILNSAKKS